MRLLHQAQSRPSPGCDRRSPDARSGFTIVEVIVAMIILTTGVLGLAGTTGLIVRQITLSDATTERSVALQSVIERLRAQDYDSVDSGSDTLGNYAVGWTVGLDGQTSKVVTVVTTGPGLTSASGFPSLAPSVTDTFTYRIVKP